MPRTKKRRRTALQNGGGREWAKDTPDGRARAAASEAKFVAYYKAQLVGTVLADAPEWDRFVATLRAPLPVTFRFTGDADAAALESELRALLAEQENLRSADDAPVVASAPAGDDDAFEDDDGPRSPAEGDDDDDDDAPGPPDAATDTGGVTVPPPGREEATRTAALAADTPSPPPPTKRPSYASQFAGLELTAQPLRWIPRGWRLNAPKQALRLHPKLHGWFGGLEASGSIVRQEAVSMVPPLFLAVRPGDLVLDACAAPGSKTSQIIETLDDAATTAPTSSIPTGAVVANDDNLNRAHTLVHNVKRLSSPCWLVTQCDASRLPRLTKQQQQQQTGGPPDTNSLPMLFDRVLCDVPCSSDGTLRKTPSVLERWNCALGIGLHSLQARIVRRAAQLCAPGGRLVYSTCSCNPVENEAVVAELLRADPTIRVVDASTLVPGLPRRPGLQSWCVFDDADRATWAADRRRRGEPVSVARGGVPGAAAAAADDEAVQAAPEEEPPPGSSTPRENHQLLVEVRDAAAVPAGERRRLKASLFPPSDNEPEIRAQLARCMRFAPHDDDTGGFFVAVLEKHRADDAHESANEAIVVESAGQPQGVDTTTSSGTNPPSSTARDAEEGQEDNPPPQKTTTKGSPKGLSVIPEDVEYVELAASKDHDLGAVVDFFGIDPSFPTRNLVARRGGTPDSDAAKRVVLLSDTAKHALWAAAAARLRVVHAGVTALVRTTQADGLECAVPFRLSQDGIGFMLPYLSSSKRVVECSPADFVSLSRGGSHGFAFLSEELVARIRPLTTGSVVCVLRLSDTDRATKPTTESLSGSSRKPLAIVTWRGAGEYLAVYCSKHDLALLRSQLDALGLHLGCH